MLVFERSVDEELLSLLFIVDPLDGVNPRLAIPARIPPPVDDAPFPLLLIPKPLFSFVEYNCC